MPKEVSERSARVVADHASYQACMTIIKARILTIQKILNNEIYVPYLVLKVESIYLQFRLLIELIYLSTIIIRRKKYASTWPRSEKEYQPAVIRKYLGKNLDEHFPYPYELQIKSDGSGNMHFFDRPITESSLYAFFNQCHQYLHEPNPYKKDWESREAECSRLLKDAEEKLLAIRRLLENHYRVTELDDGEKVGLICQFGPDENAPVFVANLISDGKEAHEKKGHR
ncbi:MAG: hypothetical protein ACXW1P_03400 [Methylophilaceae bacterium]